MSSKPPPGPDPDRTLAKPSGEDQPTIGMRPRPAPAGPPPEIAGYDILGVLGAGGMGVVYEAEQHSPRRRVALKVIRGGQFVDDLHVRLFQREADTLARLKHPDIGAIYESGRTVAGQHFFAMELIRGQTLGEYLHRRAPTGELTPEEVRFRVDLLRRIAEAVHYAHQRGVIHRDLKPSNIVVADREEGGSTVLRTGPELKVLDFGLARITEQGAQASLASEVGVIKGTLSYMSPEQAIGNPDEIDLRTDVYSLGVILYEMLAGRLPKETSSVSVLEALRVVTEQRPRPLAEVFRGTRRLDADVSTICHKALALDAADRYDGASALADDLGRWLGDLPIQARPPSATYQFRKLVARNKATSAVVGALALLLVGLAVTMSVLRGQAVEARTEAEASAERLELARADLEAVAEFQARMLSELDAERMGRNLFRGLDDRLAEALQGDPGARGMREELSAGLKRLNPTDVALGVLDEDILTPAEEAVAREFAERPEVRARLEQSLGSTAFGLGLYERAQRLLQRSLASYDEIGSEEGAVLAIAALADILTYLEDWDGAAAEIRRGRERAQRIVNPESPAHVRILAADNLLAIEQLEWERADTLSAELVPLAIAVHGADSPEAFSAEESQFRVWSALGRHAEAEAGYAELIPRARALLGNDDLVTLRIVHAAGQNYVAMERYDEGLALYREALEGGRRLQGSDHFETHVSVVNLGRLYTRIGRYEEAEEQGREAVAIAERAMGADSFGMGMSCGVLGEALTGQGRYDEAFVYLERAYRIFSREFGPKSGGSQVMARTILAGMEAQGDAEGIALWKPRAEAPP